MANIVDKLLGSDEPSVRYKVLVSVLGENQETPQVRKAALSVLLAV